MISNDNRNDRIGVAITLPPQQPDTAVSLEQILRRHATESQDNAWLQEFDLAIQKRFATAHFLWQRIPVPGRTTFKDIGDINILALKTDRFQHGIEKLSRPPDKRLALTIFFRTGCFTNNQPVGLLIADPKNGLSAGLVQGTGCTLSNPLLELPPVQLIDSQITTIRDGRQTV